MPKLDDAMKVSDLAAPPPGTRKSALFPPGLGVTVSATGGVGRLSPLPSSPTSRHYGDDDDENDDDGEENGVLQSMEIISIDGSLGEFRPSPVPTPDAEQPTFVIDGVTRDDSRARAKEESGVLGRPKKSSESKRSASASASSLSSSAKPQPLVIDTKIGQGMPITVDRPSTNGSGRSASGIAAGKAASTSGVHSTPVSTTPPSSPPRERMKTSLNFPAKPAGAESVYVNGNGSVTPPLSPPPSIPLPDLPTNTRFSVLSGSGGDALPSSMLLSTHADTSAPSTTTSPSFVNALLGLNAGPLTPVPVPPSAFRLRARTLSPAKRPSTSPQTHHFYGSPTPSSATLLTSPLSTYATATQVLVLQNHIARLETELGAAKAQVQDVSRVMTDALRAAETRENKLVERLELLERAFFKNAVGDDDAGSSSASKGARDPADREHKPATTITTTATTVAVPPIVEEPVVISAAPTENTRADASAATTSSPDKALPPIPTPIILMQELSPPMGRPLRRSRTLPPTLFQDIPEHHTIDVGVIFRSSSRQRDRLFSSASEDGHATGTHVRSTRAVRRKSMMRPSAFATASVGAALPKKSSASSIRSRSRSISRSRSRTVNGASSKAGLAVLDEAYWALRPIPKRSVTEPVEDVYQSFEAEVEAEAELERWGTMSLFTSAQFRRKRTLPVVNPDSASSTLMAPSGPTPSLSQPPSPRLSSVSIPKRRPTLSLGRDASRTARLSVYSAYSALLSPAPISPLPRSPPSKVTALVEAERAESRASSLAAVDNNHNNSSGEQTLSVPTPAIRQAYSPTNSNSNPPSGGPPSPSFEQLVDLLEDLAARTPTAARPSFESLGATISPTSPTRATIGTPS